MRPVIVFWLILQTFEKGWRRLKWDSLLRDGQQQKICILNVDSRWRLSGQLHNPVSLLIGKEPQYTVEKRVGWPQSPFECFRQEKHLLHLWTTEWFLGYPVHILVTILTTPSSLLNKYWKSERTWTGEHNTCVGYKHSCENATEVTLNWTEEHFSIQWKVEIHTCCLSGSKMSVTTKRQCCSQTQASLTITSEHFAPLKNTGLKISFNLMLLQLLYCSLS